MPVDLIRRVCLDPIDCVHTRARNQRREYRILPEGCGNLGQACENSSVRNRLNPVRRTAEPPNGPFGL
jgi:hypothetical protein